MSRLLSIGVQLSVARGWRHDDGRVHLYAEHLGGEVDGANIAYSARHNAGPIEGLPVAPQGKLAVHGTRHEVIGAAADLQLRDGLKIEHVRNLIDSRDAVAQIGRRLLR